MWIAMIFRPRPGGTRYIKVDITNNMYDYNSILLSITPTLKIFEKIFSLKEKGHARKFIEAPKCRNSIQIHETEINLGSKKAFNVTVLYCTYEH